MENLDKDLDVILSVFYDGKTLLSKHIVSTNLVIFNEIKYNLNYTPEQIIFLLDILVTDGYLTKFKPYEGSANNYSITSKGIVKHLSGGFHKDKTVIKNRQKLYDYGQIAVIIAAFYYSFEIITQLYSFLIFLKEIVCSCN